MSQTLPFTCFTTDGEIIKQIKGTNQELAEIKELLKQQVNQSTLSYLQSYIWPLNILGGFEIFEQMGRDIK